MADQNSWANPEAVDDVERGFPDLPCPNCGETDQMTVDLSDLSLKCASCDAEQSLDDIKNIVMRWSQVLAWLRMAPAIPKAGKR